MDPSISAGAAYSDVADGWALGITLLVALTGRSPISIIDKCEGDFKLDFPEIEAAKLSDQDAGWPPRWRRSRALADGDGNGCSNRGTLETSAASSSGLPASTTAGYVPSPLSMQVRETRKGTDALKGIKDNMLLALTNLMDRLDVVYAASAANAPKAFDERINFWHRECGMRADLKDRLHSLRIGASVTRHNDGERWRREGPRNEEDASQLVSAVTTLIEALERAL